MKLLTFTTLYPNAAQPTHGVFIETRLRHLLASGRASARVVAPAAFVPSWGPLPAAYRPLRQVPARETRHGIDIRHPRYFLLPKVSMLAAPALLYHSARRAVAAMLAAGETFDLIDAHYFYPDGIAAALLARHFGKPLTISARGSDINVLATFAMPRRMIRWAANQADGLIAVCEDLKTSLIGLGTPAERIRVLRNGVDLARFQPEDRAAARTRLGIAGPILLSVGNLVPLKGHDIALDALARLPGMQLLLVGSGPEEAALRQRAQALGVASRVRFLGRLPQDALPELYRAADVLLLLSSREGWANVLLEAMACGTPVVATAVGGTPEVVTDPIAGELIGERTPEAVAEGVQRLFARQPDWRQVRSYAEGFGWQATVSGQLDFYETILENRRTRVAAKAEPYAGIGGMAATAADRRRP